MDPLILQIWLRHGWCLLFFERSFAFLLGLIWYHPRILGSRWLEACGDDGRWDQTGVLILLFFLFLCGFNLLFYVHVDLHEYSHWLWNLLMSCLLWVAFAMPPIVMGSLYTGYPFAAVAIDASYQLAGYYVLAMVNILMNYLGVIWFLSGLSMVFLGTDRILFLSVPPFRSE